MNAHDNEPTQPVPAVPGKKRRWGFLTILLLLVLTGGLAYYGAYLVNQKMTASLSSLTQDLQANSRQFSNMQNELTQLKQRLQQQEETLHKQAEVLQEWQNLSQVGPSSRGRDHSAVLDAQYFVRLGGDQLLLSKDLPRALQFFNQAQLELNRVTDPQVLPLKKALEQDIATLQGQPAVNVTQIYLDLTALQQQMDHLPPLVVPVQKAETATEGQAPSAFWRVLSQMVVVYHLPTATTPPFITPDRRLALLENLHATLSDAAWAVLRHDNTIYQSNLQQASTWIREYFSVSAASTKSVLDALASLQTISVQPPADLILVSPKAFEAYLNAAAPTPMKPVSS